MTSGTRDTRPEADGCVVCGARPTWPGAWFATPVAAVIEYRICRTHRRRPQRQRIEAILLRRVALQQQQGSR